MKAHLLRFSHYLFLHFSLITASNTVLSAAYAGNLYSSLLLAYFEEGVIL